MVGCVSFADASNLSRTSSITLRAKLFKVGITFVLYGISIGNLVGSIAIFTIPMELRTFLTVEQLVILLGATNVV